MMIVLVMIVVVVVTMVMITNFLRVTVEDHLFIKTTTWSSRSLALSVMGENRKKGNWAFQPKYKQPSYHYNVP